MNLHKVFTKAQNNTNKNKLSSTMVYKALCLVWFAFVYNLASAQNTYPDNTIKAMFLANIAEFVYWTPQAQIENKTETFIITVIGQTDFYDTLKNVYGKQLIRGKKVEIRQFDTFDGKEFSHILYISNEYKDIETIVQQTQNIPTLTITDNEKFADKGVMISIINTQSKTPFKINETFLQKSGLKISHLLMRSVAIIYPVSH